MTAILFTRVFVSLEWYGYLRSSKKWGIRKLQFLVAVAATVEKVGNNIGIPPPTGEYRHVRFTQNYPGIPHDKRGISIKIEDVLPACCIRSGSPSEKFSISALILTEKPLACIWLGAFFPPLARMFSRCLFFLLDQF